MMNETEFYQKHVRKMSSVLHLERIENAVGVGFPDVSAAGGGKQFLIETKVAKGEFLYFEKFQIPFYKKRYRYTDGKGIFIMALCEEKELLVWDASVFVGATLEPYKKWNRVKVTEVADPFIRLTGNIPKLTMQGVAKKLIEKS